MNSNCNEAFCFTVDFGKLLHLASAGVAKEIKSIRVSCVICVALHSL